MGFASHLGLILDKPTVGVAKSLLCGKVEPNNDGNRFTVLKNNNGEVIGAEVVTRQGTKPVYVSVGHRVSLGRAVSLVLGCSPKFRVPEPIRQAHLLADKQKRSLVESGF
ncbi:MAG: endonuclease V [Candidatus Bathyarchaeota archaeon]|nr:endonuclease V [Candidatus Bathyarchaeota archaeon]